MRGCASGSATVSKVLQRCECRMNTMYQCQMRLVTVIHSTHGSSAVRVCYSETNGWRRRAEWSVRDGLARTISGTASRRHGRLVRRRAARASSAGVANRATSRWACLKVHATSVTARTAQIPDLQHHEVT